MLFDIIVGNPPYQKSVGKRTQSIWDRFITVAVNHLVDDGYLCYVHPNGWRNIEGNFKKTQTLLTSRQVEYLEMHSHFDGIKTFGCATTYDWYVMKNTPNKDFITTLKEYDGNIIKYDISTYGFIPNCFSDKIFKMIGKDKADVIANSAYHYGRPVDVLYTRNAYGREVDNVVDIMFSSGQYHSTQKSVDVMYDSTVYDKRKTYLCKTKDDVFKYPVIYVIHLDESLNLYYCNRNDKGHFNIPKVIWGNGGTRGVRIGAVVDATGEYGMCQYTYAIVDEPKNLDNIKKAITSKKFLQLCTGIDFGGGSCINRKIIKLFKKDFYLDFI